MQEQLTGWHGEDREIGRACKTNRGAKKGTKQRVRARRANLLLGARAKARAISIPHFLQGCQEAEWARVHGSRGSTYEAHRYSGSLEPPISTSTTCRTPMEARRYKHAWSLRLPTRDSHAPWANTHDLPHRTLVTCVGVYLWGHAKSSPGSKGHSHVSPTHAHGKIRRGWTGTCSPASGAETLAHPPPNLHPAKKDKLL